MIDQKVYSLSRFQILLNFFISESPSLVLPSTGPDFPSRKEVGDESCHRRKDVSPKSTLKIFSVGEKKGGGQEVNT